MAQEVEADAVDVVVLADVPYLPMMVTAAIKFGLGLVLGLLFGGCLAFLFEAMNTSIRRPEDIESMLHLPALAVIPRLDPGAVARPRTRRVIPGSHAGAPPPPSPAAAVGPLTPP